MADLGGPPPRRANASANPFDTAKRQGFPFDTVPGGWSHPGHAAGRIRGRQVALGNALRRKGFTKPLAGGWIHTMSKAEIMSELPKLSRQDRRDILRLIFEMEEDAETLAECDRLAQERFQMLDAMEADDERQTHAAR